MGTSRAYDPDEAVACLGGAPEARVLLTCEHASARLPAPWRWPEADRHLVGQHWAYDLGAEELARELARTLSATAVLSRFTRLLVDPNRPEGHATLFREEADGHRLHLNHFLTPEEREQRLDRYYRPYHEAVDAAVGASRAEVVLAVHSFTPVYEGQARSLEVGVLFDEEEALAARVAGGLADAGFRVELNAPYSGKQGLMYAVDRHARAHGRRALEVEVRQDLATDPGARSRVVAALARLLAP